MPASATPLWARSLRQRSEAVSFNSAPGCRSKRPRRGQDAATAPFWPRYHRSMGFQVVSRLGLLLLLVSSSFAQPSPSKAQQIDTHTRQAAEYLKNNRADMAASEFR